MGCMGPTVDLGLDLPTWIYHKKSTIHGSVNIPNRPMDHVGILLIRVLPKSKQIIGEAHLTNIPSLLAERNPKVPQLRNGKNNSTCIVGYFDHQSSLVNSSSEPSPVLISTFLKN